MANKQAPASSGTVQGKPASQEERLLKRYPQLANVPLGARRRIVRSAILTPSVLGFVFAVGVFLLPYYLEHALVLLKVEQEQNILLQLTKFAIIMLLPICAIVPLMTKVLMPRSIRNVLKKEGLDAKAEPQTPISEKKSS